MDWGYGDKVALVTGASGGIGRAVAETLAREGARVILHGHRNVEVMREWLATRDWGERAHVVEGDVRSPEAMERIVGEGIDVFGRVDVCVANAGRWTPPDLPLQDCAPERIEEAIAINLLGAIWTARGFLKGLAATGPCSDGHGAALVFVGSTAGRFGEAGHAEYAAAKAGLRGLVASLKNEIVALDPYGRVNLVEPGWTVTHMAREALEQKGAIASVVQTMPLQQLARATDIARTIAYLCSPIVARHVSGEVVTVAGGMEGRVQWAPSEVVEDVVRTRLSSDD